MGNKDKKDSLRVQINSQNLQNNQNNNQNLKTLSLNKIQGMKIDNSLANRMSLLMARIKDKTKPHRKLNDQ